MPSTRPAIMSLTALSALWPSSGFISTPSAISKQTTQLRRSSRFSASSPWAGSNRSRTALVARRQRIGLQTAPFPGLTLGAGIADDEDVDPLEAELDIDPLDAGPDIVGSLLEDEDEGVEDQEDGGVYDGETIAAAPSIRKRLGVKASAVVLEEDDADAASMAALAAAAKDTAGKSQKKKKTRKRGDPFMPKGAPGPLDWREFASLTEGVRGHLNMSRFQISARVALFKCRSPGFPAAQVKRRRQASLSSVAAQAATSQPYSGTATPELIWPFTEDLVEGVLAGNRTSLSRAITLVESHRLDHRRQADLLLDKVLSARTVAPRPSPGRAWKPPVTAGDRAASLGDGRVDGTVRHELASSLEGLDAAVDLEPSTKLGLRVGIAGPPGAGKSSFIEVLGKTLTAAGNRVAVITVDPSSMRTGGSILGDKTRMQELSRDPRAFVRGCPARGVLGGISRYTHEVVLLCQAAGYDPVIVETVGLGQSEVEVEHAVDMLLLMLPPAGGDDLQGSKKGIVEVADAIVVNKADGELQKAARATALDYAAALGLARPKITCWTPPVLRCSALRREGIDAVWKQVLEFRRVMEEGGLLETRRRQQAMHWVKRHLQQQLMERADHDPGLKTLARSLAPYLATGKLSPRAAAERLADCLVKSDSRFR